MYFINIGNRNTNTYCEDWKFYIWIFKESKAEEERRIIDRPVRTIESTSMAAFWHRNGPTLLNFWTHYHLTLTLPYTLSPTASRVTIESKPSVCVQKYRERVRRERRMQIRSLTLLSSLRRSTFIFPTNYGNAILSF